MSSIREQALAALVAQIASSVLGTVRRDDANSGDVPQVGALVTIDDGSLDVEPILSPLQYAITHSVPFSVEARRREDVDAALLGIAAVLTSDPYLGGLVDWAELSGPDVAADAPSQGGQQLPRVQTAQATITLTYLAPTPVG